MYVSYDMNVKVCEKNRGLINSLFCLEQEKHKLANYLRVDADDVFNTCKELDALYEGVPKEDMYGIRYIIDAFSDGRQRGKYKACIFEIRYEKKNWELSYIGVENINRRGFNPVRECFIPWKVENHVKDKEFRKYKRGGW